MYEIGRLEGERSVLRRDREEMERSGLHRSGSSRPSEGRGHRGSVAVVVNDKGVGVYVS